MKHRCALVVASSLATGGGFAKADLLNPLSQSRSVNATAQITPLQDSEFHAAPDFNPFEMEASASVGLPPSNASAYAFQLSGITANSISADLIAQSHSGLASFTASAGSSAQLRVRFEVFEPVMYNFTGNYAQTGTNQAAAVPFLFLSHDDEFGAGVEYIPTPGPFSESGTLNPGVYHLWGNVFSLAGGGSASDHFVEIDFNLFLFTVPSPATLPLLAVGLVGWPQRRRR